MSGDGRIGVNCAISTPFADDDSIDAALLVEHGRWVLANGADGLTVFGTTGEGAGVGLAERVTVLNKLTDAGFDMRRRIVVGITASSVEEAVNQAHAAYDADCRAILITPAFFFPNMPEDGLFGFYAAVFEALGSELRDVLLYHIPAMTRSFITPNLLARLRTAFGDAVIGVKDSSGDWESTKGFLSEHGDLQILVGSERHCAAAVREGGSGTICGMANIRPDILRPAAWDGRDVPLIDAIRSAIMPDPFPASLKALIGVRTGEDRWSRMRAPNVGLSAAQIRLLIDRVDRATTAVAA